MKLLELENKYNFITSDVEIDTDRIFRLGYREVELSATHPKDQINHVIQYLNKSDNKFIFYVDNDMTISHLNNLIILSNNGDKYLSEKLGYGDSLIDPKSISMYEFSSEKNEFSEIPFGEFGYEISWISKCLNNLFESTVDIHDKYIN